MNDDFDDEECGEPFALALLVGLLCALSLFALYVMLAPPA